jgi:rhodanese-related sulfurtransferase
MKSHKNFRFILPVFALVLAGCSTAAPTAAPVAPVEPAKQVLAPTKAPIVEPTIAPVAPALDINTIVETNLKTLPDGFAGIKPDALKEQLAAATPFLLDVREPKELADAGFIEGAVNIPIRKLTQNLDKLPAKDKPIVVYCAVGHRGGLVLSTLRMLGYTNVKSLSGGFNAWKAAKLPVVTGEPKAPAAGTMPEVDKDLLAVLDKNLSSLPDGFGGVKPDVLKEQLAAAKPFLLDVREPKELTDSGYIEGAVNIPVRTLITNIDKLPAKDAPIVIYCAIGHRGAIAMNALQLLGYTNVKSLSGGFNAWAAAKLPVTK